MIKNKKQKNKFFSYIFFPKSRRGSHISFIISFILFVSFLIFFIGIIKPLEKVETGKNALLKHLENEIIKKVSAEVLVVSVKGKSGGGNSCSHIEYLIDNKNNIFSEENDLIKIYISNEFLSPEFSCGAQDKYEIGLIRNETYALQSKVENLIDEDYETLKTNFKIPEINDFEFSFLDIDEIPIIESKFSGEIPPIEVLAELIPVTYLDEDNGNAKIKNGYIKVILW